MDLAAAKRSPPKLGVHEPELLAVEVELSQERLDRPAFADGQLLLYEPSLALAPE